MNWDTTKKFNWIQEHFWDSIPEKFQYHEADKLEDQSEIVDWFENNIEEVTGFKVNSIEELSLAADWDKAPDLSKIRIHEQKYFAQAVLSTLLFNNHKQFGDFIKNNKNREYVFEGQKLQLQFPTRENEKNLTKLVNNYFKANVNDKPLDSKQLNDFIFNVASTLLSDLSTFTNEPLHLKPMNHALLQSVSTKDNKSLGICGTIDVDLDNLDLDKIKNSISQLNRDFLNVLKGAVYLNGKKLVKDGIVIDNDFIQPLNSQKLEKLNNSQKL